MLSRLTLSHFTVFKEASFEFGPGLNVLVGDNGTGKTQVLKLGYLFCRAWPDLTARRTRVNVQHAEAYLDERLAGLFRVSDIGGLIRRGHKNGARLTAAVGGHIPTIQFRMPSDPPFRSPGLPEPMPWDIQIKRSKDQPARVVAGQVPDAAATNAFVPRAVFVPSKEIVSLFKGLIGLFEGYRNFPLDDTYRDLAVSLSTLEPRAASELLPGVGQRIQKLLGGDLVLEDGDLVFVREDGSRLESQLLAEGHRKLALLIYLLRYGVIERGSTLFWDEPEANLNPAAMRLLAEALHGLAGLGVQMVLATHSLFLLREIEILQLREQAAQRVPVRYFGLGLTRGGVTLTQGDDVVDIDPMVLLDENLQQSDRYMEAAP
jgi:hypothetical protein